MRTDLLTPLTRIVWQTETMTEFENEHGVWWRIRTPDYYDWLSNK